MPAAAEPAGAAEAAAAEEEAMLLAGLVDPPQLPRSFGAPLASSRRAAMQSRYQELLGNAEATGGSFADGTRDPPPGQQALPGGPAGAGGAGNSLQQLKARMLQPSNMPQLISSTKPSKPAPAPPASSHPGWDLSDEENEAPAGGFTAFDAPGQAASQQHLRQGAAAQRPSAMHPPAARAWSQPGQQPGHSSPAAKRLPGMPISRPAAPMAGAPTMPGQQRMAARLPQDLRSKPRQVQQVQQVRVEEEEEEQPLQTQQSLQGGLQATHQEAAQQPLQQPEGVPPQPASRPVLKRPVLRGRPKSSAAAWDDLLDDFMTPSQAAGSSMPNSSSQMPQPHTQQPLQGVEQGSDADAGRAADAVAPAAGVKRAAAMEEVREGGGDWLDAMELQPLKRRAPAAAAGAAPHGVPTSGEPGMGAFSSGSGHTAASGLPAAAGMSAAPGVAQQSATSAAAGKWRPLSQVRGAAANGTSSSFSMLSKVAVKPRMVPAADAPTASGAWNRAGQQVALSSMAQQHQQQHDDQEQHNDQEQHDESVFDMLF